MSRERHHTPVAFALGAAIALTIAVPARASDTPTAGAIIARACANVPLDANGKRTITRDDLAVALVTVTKYDWIRSAPAEWTVAQLKGEMARRLEKPNDNAILGAIQVLEESVRYSQSDKPPALRFELRNADGSPAPLPPGGEPFLFTATSGNALITCGDKPAKYNPGNLFSDPAASRFTLRGAPTDLALTGAARRTADGISLASERTRSRLDDGTLKTDTTLKIAGTVGYRLTDLKSADSVYLYAQYGLSQARTRPAPVLTPPATESDGDTDTLSFGMMFRLKAVDGDRQDWFVTGTTSVVFDLVHKTDRLQADLILQPTGLPFLQWCGFNRYREFGKLKLRCGLEGEVLGAGVVRRGTSSPAPYDSFLAIGVRGSLELFLPNDDGAGPLAKASYRILPVVAGTARKIERIDLSLGYRFWTKGDYGIDVAAKYQKGSNETSYEKEDVLSLGIGFIY